MKTPANYYPALTGIRAIAAWMVFVHHSNCFKPEIFGQSIAAFFSEFHVGVTIFFVLSGFLIANRYFDIEKINYKTYLINRFARIYPVFFILTTATFIYFVLFDAHKSIKDFGIYFMNITFLKGLFDDLKFTGISQSWSLTVEEMFYFSAPILFLLIKKNKKYLLIIPIVTIIIGFIIVAVCRNFSLHGFFSNINFMLDFTFFGRIFEFVIGIALSLLINKKTKINFKYYTYFGLVCTFFSIGILVFLKPLNGFGTDCYLGKIINTMFLPLFGIAPLFYGLMHEKTIVSRILSSQIFQILGKSSYVFYLIHIGIFAIFLKGFSENLLFNFIVLNLFSIVIYLFIEKPLNKIIRAL